MYRTRGTSTPLDCVDQDCSMYDSCICTLLSMYVLDVCCTDSWVGKVLLLGNSNRDSAHRKLHIGTQQRRRDAQTVPEYKRKPM